jgi:hypothetical protein
VSPRPPAASVAPAQVDGSLYRTGQRGLGPQSRCEGQQLRVLLTWLQALGWVPSRHLPARNNE